jgi:hypothetical protein
VEDVTRPECRSRPDELSEALGVERAELDRIVADDDARLAAVDALVGLLERKLKPERVRVVVRIKADALDGLSILEAIQERDPAQVLARVDTSFRWDDPA